MFFKKEPRKVVGIDGMHCNNCKEKIEHALEELIDIEKAKVDLKKSVAYIYYSHSADDLLITETIEKLGYSVTGIKEEN